MRFDDQDISWLNAAGFQFEAVQTGQRKGKSATDTDLLLSSHLVRAPDHQGQPTVLAQGTGDGALHAVVDALHWFRHKPGLWNSGKTPRVAVRGDHAFAVPNNTVAAMAVVAKRADVELVRFELDGGGLRFDSPGSFPAASTDPRVQSSWLPAMQGRSKLVLPAVATALDAALAGTVPSFRWYRSLTGKEWSGRVAGWQVCTVTDRGTHITWRPDSKTQSERLLASPRLVAMIRDFASQRGNKVTGRGRHKREHMLESAVLNERVPVELAPDGSRLEPAFAGTQPPFQFPALYAHVGPARYIDALMRHKDSLWVVELKVCSQGEGQYYRHALTQAVLYRDFIRGAADLHPWLINNVSGLATSGPDWCLAAVAFPKLRSRRKDLLSRLKETALCLGVRVIELPQSMDDIRRLALP